MWKTGLIFQFIRCFKIAHSSIWLRYFKEGKFIPNTSAKTHPQTIYLEAVVADDTAEGDDGVSHGQETERRFHVSAALLQHKIIAALVIVVSGWVQSITGDRWEDFLLFLWCRQGCYLGRRWNTGATLEYFLINMRLTQYDGIRLDGKIQHPKRKNPLRHTIWFLRYSIKFILLRLR